jgi:hypothetical protein
MSALEVKLSDDQLRDLARLIVAEMNHIPMRRSTVTVSEASKMLGVDQKTIRRRISAGVIKTVPELGAIRIPLSEIERLCA